MDLSSGMQDMVKETVAMFPTQLRHSATRALDHSRGVVRGLLEAVLMLSLVEQGHHKLRTLVREMLALIRQGMACANPPAANHSVVTLLPLKKSADGPRGFPVVAAWSSRGSTQREPLIGKPAICRH